MKRRGRLRMKRGKRGRRFEAAIVLVRLIKRPLQVLEYTSIGTHKYKASPHQNAKKEDGSEDS